MARSVARLTLAAVTPKPSLGLFGARRTQEAQVIQARQLALVPGRPLSGGAVRAHGCARGRRGVRNSIAGPAEPPWRSPPAFCLRRVEADGRSLGGEIDRRTFRPGALRWPLDPV